MKCFVVSLKNSDRRKDFDHRFKIFNYQFFDAITECTSNQFNSAIAKSIYGRCLRKGEIGCSLSHFNIIRDFALNSKENWLLIMEDDAVPESQFIHFINEFENKHVTTNAEILLGHSKTSRKHIFVQRLKQPLRNYKNINGISFGENKNVTLCGTVAYLINKQAANIISGNSQPYWLADDWFLFQNMGIRVYHPQIPLVYEDLSYDSSTENDIYYHHNFIKEPLKNIIHIIIGQYKFWNDSRKLRKSNNK